MKRLVKVFFPVRNVAGCMVLQALVGAYIGAVAGAFVKYKYAGALGWLFGGSLLVLGVAFALMFLHAYKLEVRTRKAKAANMERIRATRAGSRSIGAKVKNCRTQYCDFGSCPACEVVTPVVENVNGCATFCGMNYCDENGCTERKRQYVNPIFEPSENVAYASI